jgi:outer membrane protein assembly factor BamB
LKKLFIFISTFIFLFGFVPANVVAQSAYNQQWPGFRGPWGRGYIDNALTPTTWNVDSRDNILQTTPDYTKTDSSRNIKWITPIPGLGHSCPVIWDNYLFITTASSEKKDESLKVGLYGDIDMADDNTVLDFKVYCLDKNTGAILWEKIAHKGLPKSKRHTKSSQANCTPATDGKHLVVLFGSEGLYCYDFQGNLLWQKDLGIMNPGPYNENGVEWGQASSPVIFNNYIIIQCDKSVDSYLAAYSIADGKELWRTSRDEVSTWGTPAIYIENSKTQVIVNGYKNMGGYDLETGKEIWWMHGGGDAPAPTPVIAHNLIYINNAHGKMSPIYAIKPGATGDITLPADSTSSEYIAWSIKRGGAYMQTPLIYGDYLYNLQVNGQLTCFEAVTGKVIYKQNLNEAFTASGIAADGKVYFTSEEGNVYVIQAGPEYKLLSINRMNDVCMASPAISGNTLYFRTQHFVVAVASNQKD